MRLPLPVPTLRVAAVPRPSCPRALTAVPAFVPPRLIGTKPDGLPARAHWTMRGSATETHELDTRTFNPASSVPLVSHQKSPLDAPVGAVALIVTPPPPGVVVVVASAAIA